MPGLDKILYSTLERLLSSDMNTDNRIRGRGLMEMVRHALASAQLNSDNSEVVDESSVARVLGRLSSAFLASSPASLS